MARCLNCVHCDVCDSERRGKERLYGDCSDFLHAADVVPKSEVERLSVELEAMRGAANSYKMHYEKAKTEVAREIFAEIDYILNFYKQDVVKVDLLKSFAKLKKKYTKEQKDG